MNEKIYIEHKNNKKESWSVRDRYEIKNSFKCSDYLKNDIYYRLSSDNPDDINLLYKIFKTLEPTYLKKNRGRLLFSDNDKKYRGLMFKLTRYLRNPDIRLILVRISELLDNGFPIYEAIPLAHYYTIDRVSYYNNIGDLLLLNTDTPMLHYNNKNTNKGIQKAGKYTSLDDFKYKVSIVNAWNYIFYINECKNKLHKNNLTKLLQEKKYNEIKEYLNG